MLEPDQLDRYRRDGFLVVEGIFDEDETREVADLAREQGEHEVTRDPGAPGVDRSASGEPAPRRIEEPFRKRAEFRRFVQSRGLVACVEQLLGGPPLLAIDQIFMKPPSIGSAKPFHQDNYYFRLEPPDRTVTAWIALDDADERNGCLRYIAGSHLEGLLPHEAVPGAPYHLVPPPESIDTAREVLTPVRRGGVIFHHPLTLHTSGPNRSERWRRGYATHWVTEDVTSDNGSLDDAYFRDSPSRR